jgi:hypothetical protein
VNIASIELPRELLLQNEEDPNDSTDLSKVYIAATLATTDENELRPTLWAYTAKWGDHVTIKGYTHHTTRVETLKLLLASCNAFSKHCDGSTYEIKDKMKLTLNGESTQDITRVDDVECRCATARNIFSNSVDNTITGEEPPTKDTDGHTEKRKDIMMESEQTRFDIKRLGGPMRYEDHPGIIKMRIPGSKDYRGLPVLIRLEEEKSVRRGIWVPPIERATVSRRDKRKDNNYIITNAAAMFASLCHTKEVPLCIRLEDDPKTLLRVPAKYVRLYQDSRVRAADEEAMTPSNFMAGLVIDPPVPKSNRKNSSKWEKLGFTLAWISFGKDTHSLDGRGDLVTWNTKEKKQEVTNCNEHDKLRYRKKKHKYIDPKNTKRTPEKWWKEVVMPAISPLYNWLNGRVIEKEIWDVIAICFIHTSTSNDLGETLHMLHVIESSQDKDWCKETVLLDTILGKIQPHLSDQLYKWCKYIAKSDLMETSKGSTHFIWNALEMMPEDELTKYVRFSQLLVWLKKEDVACNNNPKVTAILQSLRTLQAEGFLENEPCKPQ